MTYSVKNSAGTVTYTVADGAANINAISLTFMGKGETNYGTYLNQNFLWLLENFSNNSSNPPAFPVQGQLWWDSTYKFLNVYDGTKWNTVYGNLATLTVNSGVSVSSVSAGTIGNTGAKLTGLITTNAQPYITSFGTLSSLSVNGTIAAPTIGNTGANIIGIINNNAQPYITSVGTLTGLTSSGTINAGTIGNTGATFTGATDTLTGASQAASFTTSGGGQLTGYLTGAIGANTANSGAFTTVTSVGNIVAGYANTASGLGIGIWPSNNQYYGLWNNLGNPSNFEYMMVSGTVGDVGTYVSSRTGGITHLRGPANSGTVELALTNLLTSVSGPLVPNANAAVSATLGNTTSYWSAVYSNNYYGTNFFGTSTTAKYADLAEKYLTDSEYPVGTVVMVGGDAEVTQHDGRSVRAVGVVSEHPAYMMNGDLEGGTYIALKGRVPVRVTGPVLKGQSLRGAPWGVAIAEEMSSPYTFAIALETIADPVQTIIEAVIL